MRFDVQLTFRAFSQPLIGADKYKLLVILLLKFPKFDLKNNNRK